MKKRSILIFLTAMLGIFLLCTITASAETEGYYTYSVSNGEATITGFDKSISGEVIIPSTLGGYPVTKIGEYAFHNCDITNITIPYGVTGIGQYAFEWCTDLVSITIPDSVKYISHGAFFSCKSLNNITIPDSVSSMGIGVFQNCINLTSVTISEGVTTIPRSAFSGCENLKSIIIPESVSIIEKGAFKDCYNLSNVFYTGPEGEKVGTVYDENEYYSNALFLYLAYTISNNEATITKCYTGKSGEVDVPSKIGKYPATKIGKNAFYNCRNLTKITLPDGITSIGNGAFYKCTYLISINIPESVTTIEAYAFKECISLIQIVIPDNVKSIGNDAFWQCSNLTSITLPDSVINIGQDVFFGTGYYNNAENWENESLYIGKHLIEVKTKYSGEYKVKSGTITIAVDAFGDCIDITDIIIPDSVRYIARVAFLRCENLETIVIPGGITTIDTAAFVNCENLKDVYFLGTEEEWNKINIELENDSLLDAEIHYMPFGGTKTAISDDGKTFTVTPISIELGKPVILALYDGGKCMEVKSAIYEGEELTFTTKEDYTEAKVMVWEDLTDLKPVCDAETL